ncbi:MAG: hypothetical protein ABIK86_06130, partial [candidate division WOR-3 bacterium]
MRRIVLTLSLLLVSTGLSQWIEDTLILPDRFGVPGNPTTMCFSPIQNRAYVITDLGGILTLDNGTRTKVASLYYRGSPRRRGACYNSREDQVVLPHVPGCQLGFLDCATNRLANSIPFYASLEQSCYNPTAHKVYVGAGPMSEFVSIVDCSNDSLLQNLSVPRPVEYRFGCDPVLNRVYLPVSDSSLVVIDGAGDRICAQVRLPSLGLNCCCNPLRGKVYVGLELNSVAVVDGAADTIRAIVPVPGTPVDVDYNPVTDQTYCCIWDDAVVVLDGASDSIVATIPLAHRPTRVCCSPLTNRVYVLTNSLGWPRPDTVVVIDGTTNTIVAEIEVSPEASDLMCDATGTNLYVASGDDHMVSIVDCTQNRLVASYVTGFQPLGIAYVPVGHKLYCTSAAGRHLVVLDAETHALLKVVELPEWRDFDPFLETGLLYNPLNNRLYVLGYELLSVVDCAGDTVVGAVDVSAIDVEIPAICLATQENKVYVAGEDSLIAIDAATNQVVAGFRTRHNISTGPSLCYNPDANKIYYCGAESLLVIDAATDRILASLSPHGLDEYPLVAYNPANRRVYCVGYETLAVVCGDGDTLIRYITFERGESYGIVVHPDRNKVYFTGSYGFAVLDGCTDSIVKFFPTQGEIVTLLLDPTNDKLYAADEEGPIIVVACATDEVIARLESRFEPTGLALNPVQNRVYVAAYYQSGILVLRDSAPGPTYGWLERKSLPEQPTNKPVKDGGWLAFNRSNGTVYASKGNKTMELYGYSVAANSWRTCTPMPPGPGMKTQHKGAAGCADGSGFVYATKGNNTIEFYAYSAARDSWRRLADVPLGPSGKKVKGGTSMAFVPAGRTDEPSGSVYLLKGYRNEFYRYDVVADTWQSLPSAPATKYDKGSWLCLDPAANKIYCHQAKQHTLSVYDILTRTWTTGLSGMPFVGRTGRNKKSKDGSGAAWLASSIYALKGGNTTEFWRYFPEHDSWQELEPMPLVGSSGKPRKVKAGGAITATDEVLFAFKGNKTSEFWRYTPSPPLYASRFSPLASHLSPLRCSVSVFPNPLR